MKLNNIIIYSFFIVLALWEVLLPHRKEFNLKNNLTNLAFGLINRLLIGLVLPIQIYQTYFQDLNHFIRLDHYAFTFIFVLVLFDFCIYWQHRFFHLNNFLFRVHLPHHSDQLLNVTSGIRFHPLEILLSTFFKISLLIVFNPKIEDFILYESTLLGFSLFNHSNIRINNYLERVLSYVFVTPLVHRSHHDQDTLSMNRNFGNIFVFWDKIFNTFEIKSNVNYGVSGSNHTDSLPKQIQIPFQK